MPKRYWLLSLVVCGSIWSINLPAFGQAILPYSLDLNAQQLEQQGLDLADDAIQLIRFGQYEPALSVAKLATQLAPNQAQTWFLLGNLYLQQKDLEKSIEALQKARSLNPDEAKMSLLLGRVYFMKGDYQQAIAELEGGLKLKPDPPELMVEGWFDLGNSYLKSGNFSEAIAAYERAVAQKKDFWPAINNIGLIKYEQGDTPGAIKQWQTAIGIDRQQAEPQLAVAVALYTQGKREEGLKLGEAALAIDSNYAKLEFLEENLWGERLRKHTQAFLETPQIRAAIARLQSQPADEEKNPE